MSDHNIIADVGDALIKLLREGLVPDIIQNSEGIGACSPADRGDISLGIYLYDIRRNPAITDTGRVPVGVNQFRAPSVFLDLYYMITAYSSSDIKFRSLEEAKMLGRTMQVLELETEEKNRIWNIPNQPYRLSLFYKVYPVELVSEKITSITRVVETDITIGQIGRQESDSESES